MNYNPSKHHRRSIRLKRYDYSSAGAYFVTAVLQNRVRFFGSVDKNGMQLNGAGKIAHQCWNDIPVHFPHVELDEFVIMPDHMHGIIVILPDERTAGDDMNACGGLMNQAPTNHIPANQAPTENASIDRTDWILMKNPKRTLGKIVRWYKARATKIIRDSGKTGFQWQRNYYEHIIRNERELAPIHRYILNNPVKWYDKEKRLRDESRLPIGVRV